MVSLVDIVPTVLDWFDIRYPSYKLMKKPVTLTGKSLLPLLQEKSATSWDTVYASHSLHEVTMYYPMRVIRTQKYKLIHNLNFLMPFPIDQDFYISNTYQDILNRTNTGEPLHWYKTLKSYYYRDQWELYDLSKDAQEIHNVAHNTQYTNILKQLQINLYTWQNVTNDPWICAPSSVLENVGPHKYNPLCMNMFNGV